MPSESKFNEHVGNSFHDGCAGIDLAFGFSRFHDILKTLTESDEGKLHILKVVYDVWRNHPQVRRDIIGNYWDRWALAGVKPVDFFTDDLSPGGQNDPDADN